MNNFFEQFKKEGQSIRLSAAEKSAMKARILGAPSTVGTSSASPYFFFNFQFKHTFVPVMAVLVVLLGTGTAYAAEGSLPGDLLYPVKIHVNEKVEVALASTPAAKAQVEAGLADRRVAEAETLQAQGRLDASTTQEIEDNFNDHAARALALAAPEGAKVAATMAVTVASSSDERSAYKPRAAARVRAVLQAIHKDEATTTLMVETSADTAPQATSSQDDQSDDAVQQAADVQDIPAQIAEHRHLLIEIRARVLQHENEGD